MPITENDHLHHRQLQPADALHRLDAVLEQIDFLELREGDVLDLFEDGWVFVAL